MNWRNLIENGIYVIFLSQGEEVLGTPTVTSLCRIFLARFPNASMMNLPEVLWRIVQEEYGEDRCIDQSWAGYATDVGEKLDGDVCSSCCIPVT